MSRFFKWAKQEAIHLLPAFLFFFIALNLINFTEALMLRDTGFTAYSFSIVFVAAIIVPKILLVLDNLPITNPFRARPIIYNVLWKTCLYWFAEFVYRLIDRYFHFYARHDGWSGNIQNLIQLTDWPKFWAIQIWFFMLFFAFVAVRDLTVTVGVKKVWRIFFGK